MGALIAGALYLITRGSTTGSNVTLGMEPAAVKAGQLVSAESYRVIESIRPGMVTAPITSGQIGGLVEFTSPVDGVFTRNLVQQNGQLVAEIKG
ncbi:MAG: hypothetical protein ABIK07_22190 [Planctomycetota bacterium]